MDDHAPKLKGVLWLVIACLVGAACAFGISPLAHIIPWSWEKILADALTLESPKQVCRFNPHTQALLQKLVKRIYPINPDDALFSIDVQVVKDPVVNAFAELGGGIFVNSGLLRQAQSPEEIAGILAHEIGHLHHRHILEGVAVHVFTSEGINMIFGGHTSTANWTNYFLNMDFSRSQEAQADEDGLKRLQKAHVDNQGFKQFFERMKKSELAPLFISDHPSSHSRLETAEKFENQNVTPIMTPDEWKILKNCCGDE